MIQTIARYANLAGASVILAMMLVGAGDVLLRYLLNSPIPGATDIGKYCLIATIFLGLAYTQWEKRHIAVELLTDRLQGRKRALLDIVTLCVSLIFFALITWQGWNMFWDSWLIKQYEDGLPHFPIYPSKFLVPVGGSLMCLQIIVDIIATIKGLKKVLK